MLEFLTTKILPQEWQLPATLLLFLPLLLIFLKIKENKSNHGYSFPPSPPRLPIIGNLHQLGLLPHQSLHRLAQRHGPIMQLRLGQVQAVVVSTPELAQEVMKTHDLDCCSRPLMPGPKRLSYDLKDVAFTPYGEYWREMRKLFITELLSTRRVRSAWYAREKQVDKLISNLTHASPKAVALNEHILGLIDGIIGTVAFGNIYGTEQFKHKKHFQHVLDEAEDVLASFTGEDFFPNAVGRLVDKLMGLVARRERNFHELDAFFEMVIEQHLDPARIKPENGNDLVDALIGLWKEHRGTLRFTKDHVKGLLMDTFVGAIHTTVVTILWAMSELIREPSVLNKVQDEIRTIVGKKARVEPDDIPKLPYLKNIIKESLRLHPPGTLLIPRETMRDVKIGGYDVLQGTRLIVNAWAIGRDPNSWKDPYEFNPGRFEEHEVEFNGSNFEFVPFGAGRRICPGLAMGVTNVEFTLANLLYCFDWELPDGMMREDVSMEEVGGLTIRKKTPLVLVPIRYKWEN